LTWDTKEEDVALWKEMKKEVSMKRSASQTSIDESPVSIDAVFQDPCLPRTTSTGESGWLVPVEQPGDKEDELEMMLDLDLGPSLSYNDTAFAAQEEAEASEDADACSDNIFSTLSKKADYQVYTGPAAAFTGVAVADFGRSTVGTFVRAFGHLA